MSYRPSRRSLLKAAGVGSLAVGTERLSKLAARGQTLADDHAGHDMASHDLGVVGRVDTTRFDPSRFLRAWNFSDLEPEQRSLVYKQTPREDGSLLREYEIVAIDREIEIAPGVWFPAWTYNGQVPGPTIRATEGDRIRVRFVNHGTHPHTIHFHGWHPPAMDGSMPADFVDPGEEFLYEFDAEPFGVHLYHCHSVPLKRHIHKGLYGAFIVDPRGDDGGPGRPPADEMVMVMNGFDTNFDGDNEVYAVNTVAHFHIGQPIRVKVGELVRIYLINVTEFDPINSFHLHAMFFDVFRTGTSLTTQEHTDTVMMCQAERAILETRFRYPGQFMFHAHQSEFAELGWMGLFEAVEDDSARGETGAV